MVTENPCPDDARLRALLSGSLLPEEEQAELAAHLEGCPACRQRLEQMAGGDDLPAVAGEQTTGLAGLVEQLKAEGPGPTAPTQPAAPSRFSLHFLQPSANPRHLGRLGCYEILEVIGRGGMGIVLKARDPKLERLVAVKVLSPELACSGPARLRFLREARSAAAVTHEHVVTIHAVEDAGEVPYLVMEYILGVSLEDRIQRTGHLRLEEVLRIGMQAAQGLAAAHAQGLVHRDIKPANILLENGVERVKLTDFGLARVVSEAQATESGTVAGTPQYMSPEQARGEPVDHRSDLFSLGCVLYAMCVGRSPFRAETPTGAIHRVCSDTPRPIRELNPEIPDWLAAVIDRLLAKKPEDRFQTAGEVAELLGEYLAHVQQPSRVRLPQPAARPAVAGTGQRGRGRRKVLLAGVAACLALAAGLAVFWPGSAPETMTWNEAARIMAPRGLHPVNLATHVNCSHTENVVNAPEANNLADLKPGILDVKGLPLFFIGAGRMQLSDGGSPGALDDIRGIPVGRKVAMFRFLHGCAFALPGREHGGPLRRPLRRRDHGLDSCDRGPRRAGVVATPDYATVVDPWGRGLDRRQSARGPEQLHVGAVRVGMVEPFTREDGHVIDFERGGSRKAVPFCLAITCDDNAAPRAAETELEPGLLRVLVENWAALSACAVSIDGGKPVAIAGIAAHEVLLPPGDHELAVFDGQTPIRRGRLVLASGGHKGVRIDAPHPPVAMPTPVDNLDQLPRGEAWGEAVTILWTLGKPVRPSPVSPSDLAFVDLQPYANRFLTQSAEPAFPANNLGSVPVGVLGAGGVQFEVGRRYIQLCGAFVPGCPQKAEGIRINRKVGQIHILLGSIQTNPAHGATVATYTFHYDDGSQEVFPIVSGRHVHDWWHGKGMLERVATRAGVAWVGSNSLAAKANCKLEVFHCTWENPHPDKTIRTIDFARGPYPSPAPFCLAITCDDDRTPLPPEPGLLQVNMDAWFGAERCSVVVPGIVHCPVVIHSSKQFLVPAGTHPLEVRDGSNVLQRGTFTVPPGGKTVVKVGFQSTLFPQPHAQPTPRADLVGQASTIWDLALSPDGKTLATAGGDGTVVLWQKEEDRWDRAATLESQSYQIRGLAFSPDGRLLATAAESGALRLWEVATGTVVALLKEDTLQTGKVGVYGVAFSPDGGTLIASNGDGTVDFWDVAGRVKTGTIQAHAGVVHAMALSPDGKLLATAAWKDGVVKVWDVTSKQPKHVLRGHTVGVTAVAFSPDGQTLASVAGDGAVRLWSTQTGEVEEVWFTPRPLNAVTFSPDGKHLAAAGEFQMIHVWDLESRRPVHEFPAHCNRISRVVFTPDGQGLISAAADHSTRVWSLAGLPGPLPTAEAEPRPFAVYPVCPDWGMTIAFSPDGTKLAGGAFWCECRVWDLAESTLLARFSNAGPSEDAHGWMAQRSLVFAPDGQSLITALTLTEQPPSLKMWDAASGNLLGALELDSRPVQDAGWHANLALTPDGKILLVTSPRQNAVLALDWANNARTWTTTSRHGPPGAMALAPDGKTVAVGTDLGRILRLDTTTGKEIDEPLVHGADMVTALAWSPRAPVLVSVTKGTPPQVWNLETKQLEPLPALHTEPIVCLSFSPDGALLASCGGMWGPGDFRSSHHGEVCLWDTATWKPLAMFHPHQGSAKFVTFSPDGTTLATTGRDGIICLWHVDEILRAGEKNPPPAGEAEAERATAP